MQTNHTPGPWAVVRGRDKTHPYYVESQHPEREGFDLAHCVEPTDAALIAAAPDLLAALQLLVRGDGQPDECARAMRAARAAIAKATGADHA